jgi:hypothetical protein
MESHLQEPLNDSEDDFYGGNNNKNKLRMIKEEE